MLFEIHPSDFNQSKGGLFPRQVDAVTADKSGLWAGIGPALRCQVEEHPEIQIRLTGEAVSR